MAKFCHLVRISKSFGHFLSNYLVFGKIVNLLWQIFYTFGQIFIVLNGQILKKYSHLVTLCPIVYFRQSNHADRSYDALISMYHLDLAPVSIETWMSLHSELIDVE